MGTVTPRTNKDGSTSYKAQVRVRKGGKVIHQETKTFDRRQAANAWAKKRDSELAHAEGLKAALREDPPLGDVIDQYLRETKKDVDRTKRAILVAIKESPLGKRTCAHVDSAGIVGLIQKLTVGPATKSQYVSYLGTVMKVARPLWNYPLDPQAMSDARIALKQMGEIGRSQHRDRRPTFDELDKLMEYFGVVRAGTPDSIPMQALTAMTIFSIRRISELCRIEWNDLDEVGCRVKVRDLKHPNEKIGNDTWCDLTPEAMRIIQAQPRVSKRIFPYVARTASSSFSNAMRVIGIEDLHLNDLRHEGASRLSEMGWSIQRVAAVTGHRNWNTLKRYTQYRQTGDRFAGWKWLDVLAPADAHAAPVS